MVSKSHETECGRISNDGETAITASSKKNGTKTELLLIVRLNKIKSAEQMRSELKSIKPVPPLRE